MEIFFPSPGAVVVADRRRAEGTSKAAPVWVSRPRANRRVLALAAFLAASFAFERTASAVIFEDLSAYLQRALHYLVQFRQLVGAAKDMRETFINVYQGLKDWRNIEWKDALDVVYAPWFDEVEGIDELRTTVGLTVGNAELAEKIFRDLKNFNRLESSWRYDHDGWFRRRVNGMRTIHKRAAAHRRGVFRQLQMQNDALTKDVQKISKLRKRIEDESRKEPASQAVISALQSELAAVQARWNGQDMMLSNQRALLLMIGEENMSRSFEEMGEGDWTEDKTRGFDEFGYRLIYPR
jgi:hypothetical protein